MSSRIGFIKAFYDQFNAFIGEMIELFPEDPDFRTFDTFLRLLSKTNPMQVVKLFNEYSEKFKDKINSRDESFFLQYSYEEEVAGDMVDIVGKLSKYYQTLNSANKKCIWEYLFVLKELSKKASQ